VIRDSSQEERMQQIWCAMCSEFHSIPQAGRKNDTPKREQPESEPAEKGK